MKKVLFVIAALAMCVSCKQPLSKTDELNNRAIAQYNNPVRPGYEGKNPYWNKFSKKFMYAPAFDFQAVDGAANYRYTITQNVKENAKEWTFTADAPNLSLSPVWQQVEVGDVILKVEALDKEQNVMSVAGERKFATHPSRAPITQLSGTTRSLLCLLCFTYTI